MIFDNPEDIILHAEELKKLEKIKNEQAHYHHLITLHDFLCDSHQAIFSFSPHYNQIKGVTRYLNPSLVESGLRFITHTNDFIARLNRTGNSHDFLYIVGNKYEEKLEMMQKGSPPDAFDRFMKDYEKKVKLGKKIGIIASTDQYEILREHEIVHNLSHFQLDMKYLYSTFKKDAEQIEIFFEHGYIKDNEKLKIHKVIIDNKTTILGKEITYLTANNLASHPSSTEVDELVFSVKFKNTPEEWIEFNSLVLGDYRQEFEKICFHQYLEKKVEITCSTKKSIHKI